MRATSCLLLASLLASQPARAEPPNISIEVPDGAAGLEVNVRQRDIAPGEKVDWHIHAGEEIAYVLAGTLDVQIAGGPTRRLIRGGTFQVGRDVPHRAANPGSEPASLLITYLRDKGSPTAIKVPPPEEP